MKVFSSMDIASFARQKRKQLGLTQVQLAELAGTGNRFISDLENGKQTMEIEKVITVLAILGVDLILQERGAE